MFQQSSVPTGCAVLAEVGFLAVARVRVVRRNRGVVDGCQSGCSSIFYRLFFVGGWGGEGRGVSVAYGAVGPLLELLVRLCSRPAVVWHFFRCHLSRHTKR